MALLTKKEKDTILKFSETYIKLHGEIVEVEKHIKDLEQRSGDLVNDLQCCRKNEAEFMSKLEAKYGQGKLNPMTLCWEKEIIRDEVLQ